uniref:Uncharacterized protein n=1 Tax=Lactuca sativa TaxID=4236 RepID=A0A9R1WUA0_LACSA|nr:hypothetical protein LSAT_V11C900498950 [Lactuca sativa]
MGGRLTSKLIPYVETMLYRRMQKCVRWQEINIPPEILSEPPHMFMYEMAQSGYSGYSMQSCYCGISLFKHHIFRRYDAKYALCSPPSEWEIPDPLMVVLISM